MQEIEIDKLFFMDIETVSEKEHFHLLDEEWKGLWAEKTARSLPPGVSTEDYYPMRAAILAEFAKVVCISFGYFKKENSAGGEALRHFRVKSLCCENEKELLEQFVATLQRLQVNNNWIFTGHNIKEFDIPFLCRRMIVNGIPIPQCIDFQNKKPWETPILDTLHLWRFGDYKHYTSLKLLAAVLGVPSPKDDIDGSQVGDVFWKEKDLERISVYCEKDVATVANVVLRFKGLPLLSHDEIVFVGR